MTGYGPNVLFHVLFVCERMNVEVHIHFASEPTNLAVQAAEALQSLSRGEIFLRFKPSQTNFLDTGIVPEA